MVLFFERASDCQHWLGLLIFVVSFDIIFAWYWRDRHLFVQRTRPCEFATFWFFQAVIVAVTLSTTLHFCVA
jgi:hypothetical protein